MSTGIASIGLLPHNPNPRDYASQIIVQGTPLNTPLEFVSPLMTQIMKGVTKIETPIKTIKVRLTESEYKKVKSYAAKCGLSMNSLIKFLCSGLTPQPMPDENFWRLMNELHNVCIEYGQLDDMDDYYKKRSKVIEMLIIDLQESITSPRKVEKWQQQVCGTLTDD